MIKETLVPPETNKAEERLETKVYWNVFIYCEINIYRYCLVIYVFIFI